MQLARVPGHYYSPGLQQRQRQQNRQSPVKPIHQSAHRSTHTGPRVDALKQELPAPLRDIKLESDNARTQGALDNVGYISMGSTNAC